MLLVIPLIGAVLLQAAPVKLASTTFNVVNTTPELAAFWTDHFAQQLSSDEVKVTTSGEITSLLGLERQKALLGCGDEASSCMAELANALGVDGLVRGSVGRFGDTYQVNVRVVAANDGRELAKFSATVTGENKVVEALTAGAIEVREQLTRARHPSGHSSLNLRAFSWIPAVAGVAGVAVGAWQLVSAQGRVSNLQQDRVLQVGSNPVQYAQDASSERMLGIALTAVGSVAIAGGASMFLFGGPAPVAPVAVLTPEAGFAGVVGAW